MMMPQSIIALQELEKEKLPVIIMAVSPVSGGVTASWVYGPSVFLFAEMKLGKTFDDICTNLHSYVDGMLFNSIKFKR